MKFKIALFFLFLFTGVLIAPAVLSLVKEDQGLAIALSLDEDEEKNAVTKTISKTIISASYFCTYLFCKKNDIVKNICFTSKIYSLFPQKTVTPPPEFLSLFV